ncbi:type II toxin-antitoxin system VapC family toxin [Methylicorpusculum oleiharenae]|uniref:type II toxin-antitoxin system VapC family toxin n=1 Tax=Methylicorpusculum oleiharenae TaxID=1338687 RepID=UPI0013570712|nr:type II toxin-antitoxin system VapC family toxin [Methylicorpusculum oleiharenae]MCD2449361.1 type II toxin-antitoxin system VapC family toxin [Methylicorpusculum oleiharenae]
MSDKLIVYLDTSALAKWYLEEANSDQVTDYIVGLDRAIISTLTKTEMRCLLARRKRMKEMSSELEALIYATFLEDIAQGHLALCQVEDKHLDSATHLIDMLPGFNLRTLDAMHLAIAQHHGIQRIATADNFFAKAAEALGFKVDSFGN